MRLSGEMIGCAGKWRIRSFWRGRGGRVLFSPFCTRFVPDNEMWWMKVPIFLDFFPCCVGIDESAA